MPSRELDDGRDSADGKAQDAAISPSDAVTARPVPSSAPQAGPSVLTWLKSSTLGNIVVLGVVTALVLVAVWAANSVRGGRPAVEGDAGTLGTASAVDVPDSGVPAPAVGEPAPLFSAVDLQGQTVDLETMRGTPVWLVFNATWCANCRAELPDIEEMQQQFGDRVQIVGIYVSDSEAKLADYAERLNLTFPQVPDPGSELGALYRVLGVPSHYFIDDEGTLVAIDVGTLSPKVMRERLETLLAG